MISISASVVAGSVQLVQTAGKHSFFKQLPTQSTAAWVPLSCLSKERFKSQKKYSEDDITTAGSFCVRLVQFKSNKQINKERQRRYVAWVRMWLFLVSNVPAVDSVAMCLSSIPLMGDSV